MRLTRNLRVDRLQNDARKRSKTWDRTIYFGLVGAFLVWMFDTFAGSYLYLRADGLVLRDRVVLATQFTAQVASLSVDQGSEVRKGQVVAQLRSQEVDTSVAKLSSDIAYAEAKRTQLAVRLNVIEAIAAIAEKSYQAAELSRAKAETLVSAKMISTREVSDLFEKEYRSNAALAEIRAERAGLKQDLPSLEASIDEARLARNRLRDIYADGRIEAPADGLVGSAPARTGSVVRPGEPVMELFTGEPYVLAYVPEGTLYTLRPDDAVDITIGVSRYAGRIARILSVTSQLPKEFQDSMRPPLRAQVVQIAFEPNQPTPTLFARPKISGARWWTRLLPTNPL